MTYFIIGLLAVMDILILLFHAQQTRDWREERAYLLQAFMARDLPELQRPVMSPDVQSRPIIPHEFSDEDFAVGM